MNITTRGETKWSTTFVSAGMIFFSSILSNMLYLILLSGTPCVTAGITEENKEVN